MKSAPGRATLWIATLPRRIGELNGVRVPPT
jgi:hypothetical protein